MNTLYLIIHFLFVVFSTMDSKLNIAFLWHQHQPYYKTLTPDGKSMYQMPWVRLHAVKDYFDLPRWMDDFPDLKQNFNLVPSLLVQLEDYVNEKALDRVVQLTLIRSSELSEPDKQSILGTFFLANSKHLIFPYRRYHELWQKKEKKEMFSHQDLTDLQVWYNLCWVGEYWKKQEPFKSLLKKGKYFTEEDKQTVIDGHYRIMGEVIPLYQRLVRENKIELSVTPFYHPILPLLCDTDIARKTERETLDTSFVFKHPEDAEYHIQKSVGYFERLFGFKPAGMWPSEGSVSEEAVHEIAAAGFDWIATDQEILEHSDTVPAGNDIFKPYVWRRGNRNIFLVFRDHGLSDAIGFTYAEMKPEAAANDFISRIEHIRQHLIENNTDPSTCLVNIILDGENCWEFYPENGAPFLKTLYTKISASPNLRSVTIGDFLKHVKAQKQALPEITRLHAGSWINHNFDIWIGRHKEKNTAWQYLKSTRDFLATRSSGNQTNEVLEAAWEELYIAEGSDWFWWFGDDHQAENKFEFDTLFRYHLIRVYDLLGAVPPAYLLSPIMSLKSTASVLTEPSARIKPKIDGRVSHFYEWVDAGFYEAHLDGDTMHISDRWIKKVYYGFDENSIYFRIDFFEKVAEKIKSNEAYALQFDFGSDIRMNFSPSPRVSAEEKPEAARHCFGKIFEAQIPLESLHRKPPEKLELTISVFEGDREIMRCPSRRPLSIAVPDEYSDKYFWSV